jgi:hypothetical protein
MWPAREGRKRMRRQFVPKLARQFTKILKATFKRFNMRVGANPCGIQQSEGIAFIERISPAQGILSSAL